MSHLDQERARSIVQTVDNADDPWRLLFAQKAVFRATDTRAQLIELTRQACEQLFQSMALDIPQHQVTTFVRRSFDRESRLRTFLSDDGNLDKLQRGPEYSEGARMALIYREVKKVAELVNKADSGGKMALFKLGAQTFLNHLRFAFGAKRSVNFLPSLRKFPTFRHNDGVDEDILPLIIAACRQEGDNELAERLEGDQNFVNSVLMTAGVLNNYSVGPSQFSLAPVDDDDLDD